MQTEGPSPHAAGLVETLLLDLKDLSPEDVVLVYPASYVGDAYRGAGPEAVAAALANMAQTCAQEGY
jgi:hypothetical protein